jgi:polyhydroxybutyrate depolymerase
VNATIEHWVKAYSCGDEATVTLKKGQVVCESYCHCMAGAEVSLCRVEGGGHTWPGSEPSPRWQSMLGPTNEDINASEIIWQFFSRHALP